jgi:MFS family permease
MAGRVRRETPMTDQATDTGQLQIARPLKTPRAAAVAGIVFSVLLIVSLVLLELSTPADVHDPGKWLTDPARRTAVAVALNLIPFAGIAFLWFIGVLRDRIGEREDRFFATVFLGSGLLFVAMIFVAAAIAGGVIAADTSSPPGAGTLALGRIVTATLVNVYAMRMAAVFTLTTVTIARRTEIVSRWLTVAGLVTALVLLIGVGFSPWVELLFPAWILALSIDILAAGLRPRARAAAPAHPE